MEFADNNIFDRANTKEPGYPDPQVREFACLLLSHIFYFASFFLLILRAFFARDYFIIKHREISTCHGWICRIRMCVCVGVFLHARGVSFFVLLQRVLFSFFFIFSGTSYYSLGPFFFSFFFVVVYY